MIRCRATRLIRSKQFFPIRENCRIYHSIVSSSVGATFDRIRKSAPYKILLNYQSSWTEVPDPKGSGLTYWRNKETNQTTALGAPKPQTWLERRDPAGSKLTYWWNPETNEKTKLGMPRPSSIPRVKASRISRASASRQTFQPRSFGGVLLYSITLGLGCSITFMIVRAMIG